MLLLHRSEWPHAESVWNTLPKGEPALPKGEPNELRNHSLIPSTSSLPAQVSREKSRGEAAGTTPALGAFGSPLQQELGVFLHLSSAELSAGKALCCVSQSCWNMMCSVSTFGRACLTLPCSLLRLRQIQSPWQPRQVTQAWSVPRSCPLTFSKRKKKPPAACNCQDTKHRFCFHNWTFDSHDSQT